MLTYFTDVNTIYWGKSFFQVAFYISLVLIFIFAKRRETKISFVFYPVLFFVGIFNPLAYWIGKILFAGAWQYCDNGKQFNTTNISVAMTKLGIKKLNTRPYMAKSKGKVEKYHQVVNTFLNEVKLAPSLIRNLDDLNKFWMSFLDNYYLNDPHGGIAEYYKQNSKEYPKEGITPAQEFNRDSRELVHLDVDVVTDAFLHSDKTAVVRKGTISFNGLKYKAEAFPIVEESHMSERDENREYETSMILAEQITTISKASFRSYLGRVTDAEKLKTIESVVRVQLGLS